MKTPETLRSQSFRRNSPRKRLLTAEQKHKADFEQLVRRASRGDSNAITAIYVAFRNVIIEEAELELGRFAADAEDVAHDFILFLFEGHMPYVPEFGAAGAWIRNTVRSLARLTRKERELEYWNGKSH